jgi:hypothetical protein
MFTCIPVLPVYFVLWLDGISRAEPCFESTKDGIDTGVTVMQKDERRTGACVFVQSGTVGDDPLVFIEV